MLSGFFNYDNPVWRFIGKLGDVIILNLLWLICSIPIVTIGASTTAVYYVTLKLVRDEEGYTIRSFFKSFKDNFKEATIIWLILLAAGVILGFDIYFFVNIGAEGGTLKTIFLGIFLAIGLFYLLVMIYIFPLQARFYNPVKRTFMNAFFMAIRHLPYTIGIVLMDGFFLMIGFFVPQLSAVVIMMGFPLMAFLNSYLFERIFEKYIPKEELEEE